MESASTVSSTDVRVLCWLILPAGLIAGLCYASGYVRAALIIAGTAFVTASFLSLEIGLYGYFAWQALDPMFLSREQAVFTPSKALAPLLLVFYVFRLHRGRSPLLVSKRFVAAMLLFGLYGLATIPLAPDPWAAFRYGAQIIVQVLLVVVTISVLRDRTTIHRAMSWAVAGGVAAAVVMLWVGGASRAFRRETLGEFANPNTTANALSLAVMCVPAAWAYCRSHVLRFFYAASIPLTLAAMMKTGSRGALASVTLGFLLSGLFARRAGFFWRWVVPTLCVALSAMTVLYVLRADILLPQSQERLERLFEPGRGLERESRWYIWSLTFRTYLKHPAGFGLGNTQHVLAQEHGYQRDAHSTYLSVLVDGGPIALALFAYALWQLIHCARGIRQTNPGIPAAMMLCYILAASVTQTTHFTKWFWIPITICLLFAEQTQRERIGLANRQLARPRVA
jgi:hypothetical protein